MTAKEIADLFVDLELDLIASLKRNLLRHQQEETDYEATWPAWQAVKLQKLDAFRKENNAILEAYEDKIDRETRDMLTTQFSESDGSEETFFGVNTGKLDALITEITTVEQRSEKAALRYTEDVYRKTILKANTAFQAGGVTMQQATDAATKDFLAQGINCIEYANGRRVNIASYAEMALRTSNTRATLLGEAQQREALGIDTVLCSQYGACSDTCLPWQGLVYIDEVWQPYYGTKLLGGSYGESRNGKQYMLLSVAIKGGLFHPNCRHHLSMWIEGVSTKPTPMDKAEIERVSKLEQQQRALERNVRKYKRLAEGTLDEDKAKEYRSKAKQAQRQLKRFIDEHSDVLRRDYWRERYDAVIGNDLYASDESGIIALADSNTTSTSGDSIFDIEKSKADYSEFLKSVPDKNRLYLEYYAKETVYRQTDNLKHSYAYDSNTDEIIYNPSHPNFYDFNFIFSNTHELAHRIDFLNFQSNENIAFSVAIKNSMIVSEEDILALQNFINTLDNSSFSPYLSDIFSALSNDDLMVQYGHSKKYWQSKGAKEREIFANIFSIESYNDVLSLNIIKDKFSDVYASYTKMIEGD